MPLLNGILTPCQDRRTSFTSFLMDARSIVSRFSKLIATSPMFIYSTALPLTLSTSSVSRQLSALSTRPIKLGKSRINLDSDEKQISLRTDLRPFESDRFTSTIFSADMRYVISKSNSIHIWNAHTGEKIRELPGGLEPVRGLAISPTGTDIASGSIDGSVQLWEVETGAAIGKPLRGHSKEVSCISFSPNAQNIASGSADCTIRIWSVKTGRAIGNPLTGHDTLIYCVAYSPNGELLASGDANGRIIIWDVKMCKPAVDMDGPGGMFSLAFSSNGKWLASVSNREVRIWNVSTGEKVGTPYQGHKGVVSSVSFSPDDSCVVSTSYDGTINIWSLEKREDIMPPLQHGDRVVSVAYSQDGSRILSASQEGLIIWNSLTGKPIIGTRKTTNNFESVLKDGSNLDLNDRQLFEGWKFIDGWLIGASGEYRLLLPPYMRKLVRQVYEGVYVHQDLHLNLCNATAKDFKGFVFTS